MMMAAPPGPTLVEKKETLRIPEKKKTKYDVIIIGAGPAGYTAGIYLARGRRDTLILSGLLPGGQLVNTTDVENYPGFESGIMGPDLMVTMRNQAKNMGVKIIDEEATNVNFKDKPFAILTPDEEYEAPAIIIATGASPRKLGLQGEQIFAGKGVSYCATCDGPFFRNQDIVVVGGGDSAMEEATFLSKFARMVHLIHRRDKFRASKVMQERVFDNEKIVVHYDTILEDISGDQLVQHVTLKSTTTGETSRLDAGAVFVAIGHEPNTKIFANQIDMDSDGYIALNGTHTSVDGVFAAGDAHDRRYRQAVTAAGFGCMAAIDTEHYLAEHLG